MEDIKQYESAIVPISTTVTVKPYITKLVQNDEEFRILNFDHHVSGNTMNDIIFKTSYNISSFEDQTILKNIDTYDLYRLYQMVKNELNLRGEDYNAK